MSVLKEAIAKAKSFLFARQTAYQSVFDLENAYTEKVLRDLAKFCRANESTFHKDERAHAVAEGRREVWLRIQHNLNLTQEELWNLYGRKDLE